MARQPSHSSAKGALVPQIERARGEKKLKLIGKLLHSYCLDNVALDPAGRFLQYEPRSTARCVDCGTMYVGTKAGQFRAIKLKTAVKQCYADKIVEPRSNVRAILHIHDAPVSWGAGPFLLVGTDNGQVEVFRELETDFQSMVKWTYRPGDASGAFARSAEPGHNIGITAMAYVAPPSNTRHFGGLILAATRDGYLNVLSLNSDKPGLDNYHQVSLPGWTEWLLPSESDVVCITRHGEVSTYTSEALFNKEQADTRDYLQTQPSAAIRLDSLDGGSPGQATDLYFGTPTGLAFRDLSERRPLYPPDFHSPVLSLAEETVHDRRYLASGLDNGQVVMLERTQDRAPRRFSKNLRSAVLGLELLSLPPGGEDEPRCYMLLALRNHTLRVLRIEDHAFWIKKAYEAWNDQYFRDGHIDYSRAIHLIEQRSREGNSWKYLLLDAVLPQIASGLDSAEVAGAIDHLARDANLRVLHALSTRLPQYFKTSEAEPKDVDAVVAASMSILESMPRLATDRRREFLEKHLNDLRETTRSATGPAARAKATAWMRIVRKYILLGHTFSTKRIDLEALVKWNLDAKKFFDAFLYKSLLYQRRINIKYEKQLPEAVRRLNVLPQADALVTVSGQGKVRLYKYESGERCQIVDETGQVTEHIKLAKSESAPRVFAMSSWTSKGRIRIALSWHKTATSRGGASPAKVTIFELEQEGSGPWTTVARSDAKMPDDQEASTVHTLKCLSCEDDILLAGLGTSQRPLGILRRSGKRWELRLHPLELSADPALMPLSPRPPGQLPIRSIGLSRLEPNRNNDIGTRYLVALGSDGGQLHTVTLTVEDGKVSSSAEPETRQFSSAVTAVEVSLSAGDGGGAVFVGTGDGDVHAFLICDTAEGRIDRLPIWRDSHRGPIRTLRSWHSDLYPDRPILVAGTGNGKANFYEARRPSRSGGAQRTELGNFLFQGMRHDRISLGNQLDAVHICNSGAFHFAAISEGKTLQAGQFYNLRNSAGRSKMFEELEELFKLVSLHEVVFHTTAGVSLNDSLLRIAELANLDGGAPRRYLVRRKLPLEVWNPKSSDAVILKTKSLLDRLNPDQWEDRESIKALCRHLSRTQLCTDLPDAVDPPGLHGPKGRRTPEEYRKLADFFRQYLTIDLAMVPSNTAALLRAPLFYELFNVHTLRHLAVEPRTAPSLRDSLTQCIEKFLAQDVRFLRLEVLRSLAIALRNARFLSNEMGSEVFNRLFPRGFESAEWLVTLILGQLARYPIIRQDYMPGTAWHCLMVLAQIVRLFPNHSLAIAQRIDVRDLGPDVLDVLSHFVRGTGEAELVRERIQLYAALWPQGPRARHDFQDRFQPEKMDTWFEQCGITGPEHDAAVAQELRIACDALGRLWRLTSLAALQRTVVSGPFVSEIDTLNLSAFAPVREWLRTVRDTGSKLPQHPGPDDIKTLLGAIAPQSPIHGAFRRIVAEILSSWDELKDPAKMLRPGDQIFDKFIGEVIGRGDYGLVYEIRDDPTLAVKAYWRPVVGITGRQREQQDSLERIRLNYALSVIPEIIAVKDVDRDRPALLMERCNERALSQFRPKLGSDKKTRWVLGYNLMRTISHGLHRVHSHGIVHRDIHDGNILVHNLEPEGALRPDHIRFKLCDFDLAGTERSSYSWKPARRAPRPLSRRRLSPDCPDLSAGEVEDMHMLGVVVYQLLTDEAIPHETPSELLQEFRDKLERQAMGVGATGERLYRVLRELLDDQRPFPFCSAGELYEQLTDRSPAKVSDASPTMVLSETQDTIELAGTDYMSSDPSPPVATTRLDSKDETSIRGALRGFAFPNYIGHVRGVGQCLRKSLSRERPGPSIMAEIENYRGKKDVRSLIVETSAWGLPWELVILEDQEVLGEVLTVARTPERGIWQAPAKSIRLESSKAIYFGHEPDPHDALERAHSRFATPSTVRHCVTQGRLEDELAGSPVDLLHVIGDFDVDSQTIRQAGANVPHGQYPAQFGAATIAAGIPIVGKNTVVLLNACKLMESGFRTVSSMAEGLCGLGAQAVITTCIPVSMGGALAYTTMLFDLLRQERHLVDAVCTLRTTPIDDATDEKKRPGLAYVVYASPSLKVAI